MEVVDGELQVISKLQIDGFEDNQDEIIMSMVKVGAKRKYLCIGTAIGLISIKCNIAKKKLSSPIMHLKG